MRRDALSHRLAALAALALVLAAPACNKVADKPGHAEAVIEVTAITTGGTSVAATTDATATLTLAVRDRSSGQATTFFNDVTFTNFTVVFTPSGMVPDGTGLISTGFCAIGSVSCALVLTLVLNGSKPAAGTVVSGAVHVEGHDFVGNPLFFDTNVVLVFVP